jgi:competence protein ComEA
MRYPAYVKKIKKFWLEIALISIAIIIAIISAILYFSVVNQTADKDNGNSAMTFEVDQKPAKMYVDVSGAVVNPGLYEASYNDRLKSLIEKAGGLADSADKDYFSRNYNLASYVSDQQKIYIPTVWEVSNGYFVEKEREMNSDSVVRGDILGSETINVNKATLEELDTLPGVGKITAQKIIDNRPYGALQELIDRKVLGKTAYENIKNLIGI